MALNNIIPAKTVRAVQLETLKVIADCLSMTFGPNGSLTQLYKQNAFPRFTKDGISVLREIKFDQPIEQSIVANIDSICTEQVKVVGDATTSIVILSHIIFEKLDKLYPAGSYFDAQMVLNAFRKVVNEAIDYIEHHKQEATMENLRDIATISTNNNKELTDLIMDIYEKFGNDVHIKVEASLNNETYLKEYDGLVLECGLLDQAFANMPDNKTACIDNPKIYAFADPVDTPEMGLFFDTIVHDNIVKPMQEAVDRTTKLRKTDPTAEEIKPEFVPTVIMMPKLSRDFSSRIDAIIDNVFRRFANIAKPPLLIISDITSEDSGVFDDITILSGCKKIRKYIDPNIEKTDIKNGEAIDPQNPRKLIHTFAGSCDRVEADYTSSKFIKPKYYYDENDPSQHSEVYINHIAKLESEYNKAQEEGKKIVEVYKYRQRLNAIKGCMVDIFVGGISAQDRDQKSDMLEDAVLNCRSACVNGVGYGANFEALRAFKDIMNYTRPGTDEAEVMQQLAVILFESYKELGKKLYMTHCRGNEENALDIVERNLVMGSPMNIRLGGWPTENEAGKVLSSIKTDQCVLNSIAEILSIMFVTNQMLINDFNRHDYFVK